MGKGADFERDVCRQLSLWWTGNRRDDIFWRSSQSGGRATTRASCGKSTFGSYGDIAAVDPSGIPLLDLVTIEVKRGYSRFSLFDVLDRNGRADTQEEIECWFQQASDSKKLAGSFSWLVISRRSPRAAAVFFPWDLHCVFRDAGCFDINPHPCMMLTATFRRRTRFNKSGPWEVTEKRDRIMAMRLDTFFHHVTPQHVRALYGKV